MYLECAASIFLLKQNMLELLKGTVSPRVSLFTQNIVLFSDLYCTVICVRERYSCSVLIRLIRDQGVADLSFNGVTAL